MVPVAIVGAAGYAGIELTRLLIGHPAFEPVCVTSTSDAGRCVSDVYPGLAPCDLVFETPDIDTIKKRARVAFLAVPHTAALVMVPALLEAGLTVIDCSADFRLRDPDTYQTWYGVEHSAPEFLKSAIYGLPELWRDAIAGARLVACPGCYPTATLLAAAPAVRAGIVCSSRVIVDAISGISGAGRTATATTHFVSAAESVAAYGVARHRHTPEIAQGLTDLGLVQPAVVFTPHLAPLVRGLLATVYLEVCADADARAIQHLYASAYSAESFVTVCASTVQPATGHVRGSNRAHIGIVLDPSSHTLIATCAIDNLMKGAAGQAVQCANLICGFAETAGLDFPSPIV